MKIVNILKATGNIWKLYWPTAARAGYKASIIAALGCGMLSLGEPAVALSVMGYLFWFIMAIMALFILIPFTIILARGKFRAMARVKIDFQKEWKEVWTPDKSDPLDFLFP